MSSELSILAMYGLLIIVLLLIHIVTAMGQVGLPYLASPRDEKRELTGTAGRSKRCFENAVISMALFAPAVLILQAKGGFTDTTLLMAQLFLVARGIHAILYYLGIPWVRTLAFVAALLATAYLYFLGL